MDFDKIRLATSVQNRILNIHDAIKAKRTLPTPAVPSNPPQIPNTIESGVKLENDLEKPAAGAATPAGDAAASAALTGGVADTPLEGLLMENDQ